MLHNFIFFRVCFHLYSESYCFSNKIKTCPLVYLICFRFSLVTGEFGQKIRFDFGMSVFSFVGFCNAEFKSSFLLRFISVAREYSSEHRACFNEPLKCIAIKIKTYHKAKIFIPNSNLLFCPNSLMFKLEEKLIHKSQIELYKSWLLHFDIEFSRLTLILCIFVALRRCYTVIFFISGCFYFRVVFSSFILQL